MMAEKAKLFDDQSIWEQIVDTKTPSHAKKLGRQISNFDDALWTANRFEIVVKGNLAKFTQNKDIGEFLIQSNNRVIVEASPPDKIWGIGMAADHPQVSDPNSWKGLNLLGFALMKVRSTLEKIN